MERLHQPSDQPRPRIPETVGRHFFGAASLLLGIASLALHDQLISNWQLPGRSVFIALTSVALVIGGVAMQFRKTDRRGALLLGAVYLLLAITFVPAAFADPRVYESWGNVFYALALVTGAIGAYALSSPQPPYMQTLCNTARILLGVCNISFAIEQVEFLSRTVSLVPKWIPPNGMFWGIGTAIAFGLAGLAMLVGYKASIAARLAGVMLAGFGALVWIPILIADPRTHSNWSEGLETFAIAGAAWIVAELLSRENPVGKST